MAAAINEAAQGLKEEVINRKVSRIILKPLYLQKRGKTGTIGERLQAGMNELEARIASVSETEAKVQKEIDEKWEQHAKRLAPGASILDACCQSFSVRFQKDSGDSAKLAKQIETSHIPNDIQTLLRDIGRS